jgi:hypothetical protein
MKDEKLFCDYVAVPMTLMIVCLLGIVSMILGFGAEGSGLVGATILCLLCMPWTIQNIKGVKHEF